jgi:hypothetical protein
MRALSPAVLLLLVSCAAPMPVFKPVAVDIPVTVPCAAPAIEKPAEPLRLMTPQATLFDKVRAALIESDMRKAYETRLEAALAACQ